jgi:hypothetical protein
MASTSTNKQPLLVDRVLHEVVDLVGSTVAQDAGVDISGTNSAALIIDCTTNDGAILEDIYSIGRTTAYKINLYLSAAADYLRTQQSVYIGTLTSSSSVGTKTRIASENLPYVLAPMPHAGTDSQFNAIYIPRGRALWAAVEQQSANDQAVTAPLLGVQGGYY